jgi:hypothetical protein
MATHGKRVDLIQSEQNPPTSRSKMRRFGARWRTVHDQELMFYEYRLSHNRSDATRQRKSKKRRGEMDQEHKQITHEQS